MISPHKIAEHSRAIEANPQKSCGHIWPLNRCTPHPETPLAGHLADQPVRLHPSQVALNSRATGAGQSLGHRRRDQGPFGQQRAEPKAFGQTKLSSRFPPESTIFRYRRGVASLSGMRCPFRRASGSAALPEVRRPEAPLPRPWPAARKLHPSPRWPRSGLP